MKVIMVIAVGMNGEIGTKNGLPWRRIPEDMKHFRDLTLGKEIVYGRNTFESFGEKLLPKRANFVITTNENTINKVNELGGTAVSFDQVEQYIGVVKASTDECKDLYIIGGAQVYNALLDKIDVIHATFVTGDYPDADTHIDMNLFEKDPRFKLVSSNELCNDEDLNATHYEFHKV